MSRYNYYVLLLGFLMCFVSIQAFPPPGSGYKVGDYVADFNLKNVDGKQVSLADYGNAKGIVLVFTCNSCPFSKAYEARLVALDKQLKAKGYPVVAINPNSAKVADDSYANMQVRAKEAGFTFPYLDDTDQSIARLYGATRTPHVYVLQRESKRYKVAYIGAIDDNYRDASEVNARYVEDAVNALLKGEAVKVSETKAIGCTIKWASASGAQTQDAAALAQASSSVEGKAKKCVKKTKIKCKHAKAAAAKDKKACSGKKKAQGSDAQSG